MNLTVLEPWLAPKPTPLIVTSSPTDAAVGFKLLIAGGVTVKGTPALATLATVTITFPVVAPDGTVTVSELLLQAEAAAATPLNVTVLVPWVEPKPDPPIVTVAPTKPAFGDRLAITGFDETLKAKGGVATPFIVTTTLPLVNPAGGSATRNVGCHIVGVAGVPPKVSVLDPCEEPKGPPLIWTLFPKIPGFGEKLVMLGLTVKLIPLLK